MKTWPQWKIGGLLLSIFLVGAVTGGVITLGVTRPKPKKPIQEEDERNLRTRYNLNTEN